MTLVLDGHIHLTGAKPAPAAFLAELQAAGIAGAPLWTAVA